MRETVVVVVVAGGWSCAYRLSEYLCASVAAAALDPSKYVPTMVLRGKVVVREKK